MYGYIYKTTNLVNGKIYVGQHKSDALDLNYFGSGILLAKALEKYGKVNFSIEIIEWCETKEILNEREYYWITELNSRSPDIGYNIAFGGTGGDIYNSMSDEQQQHQLQKLNEWRVNNPEEYSKAQSRKGEKNGMWGKTQSQKTKDAVSKAQKGRKRSNEWKENRADWCRKSKWYNNGVIEKFTTEKPEGFVEGRLKKVKIKKEI